MTGTGDGDWVRVLGTGTGDGYWGRGKVRVLGTGTGDGVRVRVLVTGTVRVCGVTGAGNGYWDGSGYWGDGYWGWVLGRIPGTGYGYLVRDWVRDWGYGYGVRVLGGGYGYVGCGYWVLVTGTGYWYGYGYLARGGVGLVEYVGEVRVPEAARVCEGGGAFLAMGARGVAGCPGCSWGCERVRGRGAARRGFLAMGAR